MRGGSQGESLERYKVNGFRLLIIETLDTLMSIRKTTKGHWRKSDQIDLRFYSVGVIGNDMASRQF